uniref:Uncharacterized protein n=1 Tax=Heterosigma akashiwo TaxID=2829 RepID=A0A6V1RHC4_HETAK
MGFFLLPPTPAGADGRVPERFQQPPRRSGPARRRRRCTYSGAGGGGGGGLWRRALRAFNAEMIPFKQEKHARALAFDPTTGALDLSPLPRNFGWVVDGRVAGCAIPTLPAHLAALRGVGVARVITIHEQPLPAPLPAAAAAQGVDLRHFPCDDRAPPAPAQLAAIVALMAEAVEAGEAVAVHCQGGVGRTATALAAYLVRAEGLSAAEALARLTARRKVLVTEAQTAALRAWWRAEQDAAVLGSAAEAETKEEEEEAVAATAAEGGAPDPAPAAAPPPAPRRPAVKLPRLILLCGLAASGKSTFAQALVDSFPDRVARVNKDEMRGKGEVDAAFAAAARRGLTVVVDMCNLTAEKRRAWAAAAWGPGAAWLVELATDPGACQYRAARRAGHPTLPPRRARGVIEAQARQYEPPTAEEGFAELIRLETEEAAAALLEEWGAAPPRVAPLDAQLVKFPRTHHAVNLGAATRDDRVLPEGDLRALLAAGGGGGRTLVVEEKLDGANMGLSIGRDGAVRAQNRSHFVTSGYHAQFKPLDKWLQQHTGDLWDVLQPEEHPERYILYGEWLHATHSVKYTRLPGWFVAFDLYDRRAEKFLGRGELARRLRGTRLPLAPLVHEGPLDLGGEAPAAFLRRLAHGPSAVTDGRREGVVLKVLGPDGRLEARAKVVREDFIAGNERWDRAAKLEVNQLDPEVFCG